jgi:peptide/nickel transport system substrate-binding protein
MKKYGLTGLLLLVLMLAGCRAPSRETADPGEILTEYMADATPEQGDVLRLVLPAEMPHLNPLTSTDYYASTVLSWVFDTLLDRDQETLESLPALAERWEVSEDHLSYTFHLRKDVVFSDGVPLTAKDVKFTFDMVMDPAVDAPNLRNYYKDVQECQVPDEYTVRFVCDEPYYQHLIMLGGLSIIPEHIYGEGDFNRHPNNRKPVGSGMYTLEEWETGQRLNLQRNTRYWGTHEKGWPWFDRIEYAIIPDDNTAFQVLTKGELDFMSMPAELFMRRANTTRFQEQFNRFAYFRPAYNYLGWNMRKPMFKDKETRQALTMLLDRELIREEIYYGQAVVIAGNFMPGTAEWNEQIAPLPFDPQQAQELLKQAGWQANSKTGILERDGLPFRFDAATTNQNPVAEKILTLYKEELARVGIDLTIRLMEWASLLERVDKREFDAILMGWSMPPDPDPYQVWHSSQTDAGSNYVGFINEEADKIVEEARRSFDREERIRLYHRFQEILHEEQPYLFMLTPKVLAAGQKRLQGIQVYPFGVDQREWFVPKDLQRVPGQRVSLAP